MLKCWMKMKFVTNRSGAFLFWLFSFTLPCKWPERCVCERVSQIFAFSRLVICVGINLVPAIECHFQRRTFMLECSNAEISLKESERERQRSFFSLACWLIYSSFHFSAAFVWFFFFLGYVGLDDIDTYSSWHYDDVAFCVVERATRRYYATPSSNWQSSTAALRCYCCRYSSDCHCCPTYPHSDSLQWCSPLNCCWFSGSLSSRRTTRARISQKSEAIERNQWQSLRLTVMISFVDGKWAPVEWQMAFH